MTLHGQSDSLVGCVVRLPEGVGAEVLDVDHEYDDGTTLRYVDGPNTGALLMRDTFLVRRYEVWASARGIAR